MLNEVDDRPTGEVLLWACPKDDCRYSIAEGEYPYSSAWAKAVLHLATHEGTNDTLVEYTRGRVW